MVRLRQWMILLIVMSLVAVYIPRHAYAQVIQQPAQDDTAYLPTIFSGREIPEDMRASAGTVEVLVPVYLYYVERYFNEVEDRTETDAAIAAILDESPQSHPFFLRALENYRELPDEIRRGIFNAQAIELTTDIHATLDLETIRDLLAAGGSPLVQLADSPPAAPTNLVAKNASTFEPVKYQIELKWKDNASDEQGFAIYRAKHTTSTNEKMTLLSTVGPNATTFTDPLTKPANAEYQYCYQVVAFKVSAVSWAGKQPERVESLPTGTACAYYEIGYPPETQQIIDTDKDGIPDQSDECPTDQGPLATDGCPDVDQDAVPDKDDQCPLVWGPTDYLGPGPFPAAGCPYKFNIRWMEMKVLNNSAPYAYSGFQYDKKHGNEGIENAPFDVGEEPYLVFSFANGMTSQGALHHWTNRWCCGEQVDVKQGKNIEPDQDSRGEEYPTQLQNLLNNGLTVFPVVPGQFAEIDKDLGLAMTVSLMERDWDRTLTPEEQANYLDAAFKVGGAVVGAVASCVGSLGLGCLLAIGGAMKTVVETAYDLSQTGTPVQVQDADDHQGTDIWAITRNEAVLKTAANGAYAFWFDMPTTYWKTCFGWSPCPVGTGVPITMRARLTFCLYREGIPDNQIKKVCTPSHMVLPWPMTPSYQGMNYAP